MGDYKIIFDEVILKQLKKLGENEITQTILSKMMDKIEEYGPRAGKLLDSKLFIYEMKSKVPPIRLYFKHLAGSQTIYLFEYEIKTSAKEQQKLIEKIRSKTYRLFRN